jgi:hypothetical protein
MYTFSKKILVQLLRETLGRGRQPASGIMLTRPKFSDETQCKQKLMLKIPYFASSSMFLKNWEKLLQTWINASLSLFLYLYPHSRKMTFAFVSMLLEIANALLNPIDLRLDASKIRLLSLASSGSVTFKMKQVDCIPKRKEEAIHTENHVRQINDAKKMLKTIFCQNKRFLVTCQSTRWTKWWCYSTSLSNSENLLGMYESKPFF